MMESVREEFSSPLAPRWRQHVVGQATLEPTGSSLRFVVAGASRRRYSNAQIDDYQGLPRRRFPWRPPLRLTVRARFSHRAGELLGTAGFGFWNDPFMMTEKRMPTLPRAVWFFYASPPSDMRLDPATPGWGWKAATIDAVRPVAPLLAVASPVAVLLMNMPPIYRLLWPPIRRALHIWEASLPVDMTQWHVYRLEWNVEKVRFAVDEEIVLDAPYSPGGPVGFVMWLDNQYLVVTPWGRLRWGLLEISGRQWMEVDTFAIDPMAA